MDMFQAGSGTIAASGVFDWGPGPGPIVAGSGRYYTSDPDEISEGGVFYAYPEKACDPKEFERRAEDAKWAKKVDAEFLDDLLADDNDKLFMASNKNDTCGGCGRSSSGGCCSCFGT